MRNFLKIGLIASMLFAAPSVQAADDYILKVGTENEKSVSFFVDETQDVSLSFLSAFDEVIYQQELHLLANSTKTYDLKTLPDGKYTLKLESGAKMTTYNISIQNGKTEVSGPTVTSIMKASLAYKSSIVTLNVDNLAKQAAEVRIINEYNEEVYKQTFTDQTKLIKKFDISKSSGKEFTFSVVSKGQEFIETISVR